MSRRELADAANAYVWRHTSGKQHTNMTEHDIGRYERGEVRWPGRWRRLGLRGALKVATDKELGFYPNRQVSPEPVSCAIGECQGPPATDGIDQLTGPSSHNRLPREATSFFHEGDEPFQEDAADELRERLVNVAAVDKRGMELLSIQIDQIREVDRRLGTRASRAQMRGHLAALEQLRTFSIGVRQREMLADLYADAAALAGWQSLDLGDFEASWRYHEAARNAGLEGSSPAALAHAMAQQAYILAEVGELTSATELAEHARSLAGTAVPSLLLAWLTAVQGELHALSGDDAACRRSFEISESLLPTEACDPDLPYIFLDDVHLVRWRGNALAPLGDPATIDELRSALDSMDRSFIRARAGMYLDLAYALVAARRYPEARVELDQAKSLAARVGSVRQRRRVRRLESMLQAA